MPNLGPVPMNDVDGFERVLTKAGFEVEKLVDQQATKDVVAARFLKVLDGDVGAGKKARGPQRALGGGDVLLVVLCSHGFTLETTDPITKVRKSEPFVAAHDSRLDESETMISLNAMIAAGKNYGAAKLFLLDACREETDPNRGRTRGVEGGQVTLPGNTAILFSCARGQLSQQPAKLNHGLFTHAVLRSLRGDTGLEGELTWADLVADVSKSFRGNDIAQYIPKERPQRPVHTQGEGDNPTLLTIAKPKTPAGDTTPPVQPKDPPAATVKARVQPASGADVGSMYSSRIGGENSRIPGPDKGVVVTVEETVGTRSPCHVDR